MLIQDRELAAGWGVRSADPSVMGRGEGGPRPRGAAGWGCGHPPGAFGSDPPAVCDGGLQTQEPPTVRGAGGGAASRAGSVPPTLVLAEDEAVNVGVQTRLPDPASVPSGLRPEAGWLGGGAAVPFFGRTCAPPPQRRPPVAPPPAVPKAPAAPPPRQRLSFPFLFCLYGSRPRGCEGCVVLFRSFVSGAAAGRRCEEGASLGGAWSGGATPLGGGPTPSRCRGPWPQGTNRRLTGQRGCGSHPGGRRRLGRQPDLEKRPKSLEPTAGFLGVCPKPQTGVLPVTWPSPLSPPPPRLGQQTGDPAGRCFCCQWG